MPPSVHDHPEGFHHGPRDQGRPAPAARQPPARLEWGWTPGCRPRGRPTKHHLTQGRYDGGALALPPLSPAATEILVMGRLPGGNDPAPPPQREPEAEPLSLGAPGSRAVQKAKTKSKECANRGACVSTRGRHCGELGWGARAWARALLWAISPACTPGAWAAHLEGMWLGFKREHHSTAAVGGVIIGPSRLSQPKTANWEAGRGCGQRGRRVTPFAQHRLLSAPHRLCLPLSPQGRLAPSTCD